MLIRERIITTVYGAEGSVVPLNTSTTARVVKQVCTRDDSRLRVYAYFYYMAVGAGLSPDLAAVYISSRLSNLLHDVKFQHLVTQLVLIQGQIVGL